MPLSRFRLSVLVSALVLSPVLVSAQEADPRLPQIGDRQASQAESSAADALAAAEAAAAALLSEAETTAATVIANAESEAAALLAEAQGEAAAARTAAIEAAEGEAAALISEAEAAAEALLRGAEDDAARIRAEAESEAAATRARAETNAEAAAAEADTRAEAAGILAAAQSEAEARAAEIITSAESEAARILEEARAAALRAIEEERARIAAEEEAARLAAEEAARIAAEEAALAAAEAALAACLATAGTPDAGVPVSEEAQAAALAAVRSAEADCAAAAEALPDRAAPALFHLATLAQTSGEHREAIALYEEAAEGGIVPAQTRLADYYLFGTGPIRPDFEEAAARYSVAAEAGDPAAQTTLGFLHLLGRGVDRDPARMVELMTQAADAGYHFAQFRLAQTYLSGEGIPNRDREALGIPDVIRAAELFEAASENGNAEAALILADLYAGNIDGLIQSDEDRFRWTERAAETGDADAIAALAFLIERGTGTERNPALAAQTYIRALEEGVSVNDLRPAGQGWDRDTAIAFQQILIDRGLYNGALDGIVGAGTLAGAQALRSN